MDGRSLEKLAQQNKNWAKEGFGTKTIQITPQPIKKVINKTVTENPVANNNNTYTPTLIAIKCDEKLYSISKFDNPDLRTKLNCELLQFLFAKYSQYGLLPISDLIDFIKHNDLMKYLTPCSD
jgi:hypothetical protein